ncbi:hypothetical protein DM860_010901 [Cuscuta australis]|uniref:RING-type domain-containing protein n=1 Tax=Cuscuta australis TaxID=267555 RepID=A0A328E466_9ASTE|nr:hypothetical protein DM860_010901 [Cuscuta australis]
MNTAFVVEERGMSSQEFQEHHLSGSVLPPEFTEDLIKCFPEDGGLSYEEICIQQESLYLAFQKKGNTRSGETSQSNSLPGSVRSSSGVDVASQLALDEALARSLQIDDGFDDIYTLAAESPPPREPPPPPCPPPHRPPPPPSAPARVIGTLETARHNVIAGNMSHDVEISNATNGINPDNMSYEELQSLGDAIGHESKGLSDDMISRLPTFRYNCGFFFWKKKNDDGYVCFSLSLFSCCLFLAHIVSAWDRCVICCSEYANREKVTSLLCAHTFHFKCIVPWLRENKVTKSCIIIIMVPHTNQVFCL